MIALLFTLIFWHFLADYPLQGDFLAKAKVRKQPIPGMPWWQAMFAHSFIHAGGVALLTGTWWLGLLELVLHFGIDVLKTEGHISFNVDQALHIGCKVFYVLLLLGWSLL